MTGEIHHLGVIDNDGVFFRAPGLRVVQVYSVNRLFGGTIPTKHKSADSHCVGSRYVQQAIGLFAVKLQDGPTVFASVNPHGITHQCHIGGYSQVMAAVHSRREPDGAIDLPCGIERLLDRFGVRGLPVSLGPEIQDVKP